MIWDNGLKNDMIVTEEIRTIIGKPHGLDIASIDLRRSEDHAVSCFNEVR